MFVVKKEQEKTLSLPTKEISVAVAKAMGSELAEKILKLIAQRPHYAAELAKELKVHEQKIYYHIRNLEKHGIIKVVKKETKQGAIARYYDLTESSFVLRFKPFEPMHKIHTIKDEYKNFLEPFIVDGNLNTLIIVGSPDPHGPDKARSRDGYYGMDLALFLGTFLNYVPRLNIKLDTETREDDLKNNLILIGGPIVNKITERFNDKLPIRFTDNNITSSITNQTYTSDETGLIVKRKNPFDSTKQILLVAGKRHSGTRATIIAFLKHFDEICQGNTKNPKILAKVVEGIDLDSDGVVDEVEIKE